MRSANRYTRQELILTAVNVAVMVVGVVLMFVVRPAAIGTCILLVGIVSNSIVIFRIQQARTRG